MVRKDLIKNVTELRKDPIGMFKLAEEKDQPLYIFNRTEPLGVVLGWDDFNTLAAKATNNEEARVMDAVSVYEQEKAQGKLKQMKKLGELFD